jgi:hypothetical protein
MCNYVEMDHYQKTVFADEKELLVDILLKYVGDKKQ